MPDTMSRETEAIDLIKKIEQMQHSQCYGCPACMAHKFLYGHWPNGQFNECCWPANLRKVK